jgi:hypothetical protein
MAKEKKKSHLRVKNTGDMLPRVEKGKIIPPLLGMGSTYRIFISVRTETWCIWPKSSLLEAGRHAE